MVGPVAALMRIGLLSDVHANLPALRAALDGLRAYGVDRLLVAGDLVGYGAQPNECVDLLAASGAECIAGNHDLFVLDRLPNTRFPPLARRSAILTRAVLSSDARTFLASLPRQRQVDGVVVAHGSPGDPQEYVTSVGRALELLDRLRELAPGSSTLVLGHTHRQWCVVPGLGVLPLGPHVQLPAGACLINPGSVGQSRQRERRPRARFAVLDTECRRVGFLSVDYDVAAARAALQDWGLSDRCLHAPARARALPGRAARRVLRRARSLWG